MSKSWKIILIIFISIIIATGAYMGYQYFKQSRKANLPVLSAVSPSAAFFIETDHPVEAFTQIDQSNLWNYVAHLEGVQQIGSRMGLLDSIILSNHDFKNYLSSSRLVLSLNVDDIGKLSPLFLVASSNSLKNIPVDDLVYAGFGNESIVMVKSYHEAPVKIVNLPKQNSFFYYTFYRGIFAGSFSEDLIKQTIDQISNGEAITADAGFRKVRETAGQNVDANLYVNGKLFGKWFASLAAQPYQGLFNELERLWDWTEADIVVNQDELLFNGYSVVEPDGSQLLSCFAQPPQDITITDILPYNTAYMMHFGVDDFERFYTDLMHCRSDSIETLDALRKLNDKFGIAPYDAFISWVGNEIALAGIPDQFGKQEPLAVIKSADILKARISLLEASKRVDRRMLSQPYELTFRDYKIYKLGLPNLAAVLFGSAFEGISENYFVFIKDCVLFANSPEFLQNVIESFYKGKTLSQDLNYQAFSNNISLSSNIFLYSNIRKSANALPSLFKNPLGNWLADNAGSLGNLEGVALQWSYINEMFYTNIFLKYNPEYKEINPSTWVFETEYPLAGKPYLIRNHRNNKLNTIVFDENNNMYLADHIGRIKWKLPLIEAPVGDLIQIDFYGNGKYQYLFNTLNYVYVVDLNGDYLADFPVRLPQSATGPIACFDYENDHDYRFVIALNDNRIYNFDKELKAVDGWHKIQARAAVEKPVQHLVSNKRDYFFVQDIYGKVLITNRRGEERIVLRKAITISKNNEFYLNKTNSNGLFICTSPEGKLLYIAEDGKLKTTDFGKFSPAHYFFYFDFNSDGAEDFIFVDQGKITVFDRFKKIMASFQLPAPTQSHPIIFENQQGKPVIGMLIGESKDALFYSMSGEEFTKAGIKGTYGISIGSINNDNILNAIVPFEKNVKNYQLD